MTELGVLVCIRADRPPGVPSYADRCARCGAEVWRSTSSLGYRCVVECTTCAIAELGPGIHEVVPAPWVAGDLATWVRRP